ncbi:proton-conducting transporter membrane subunit [Roseomonas sp. BN140053]|uniref:proton-conducting transporter transmembrane domain-containing protein n=1 Tax=Roseomonas sp. BN140053 TaxID=3391898 RepID=UPI0039E9E3D9
MAAVLFFLLVLLASLLVLALAGAVLRGPAADTAVLGGSALAGLCCAGLGLLALVAPDAAVVEWFLPALGPDHPGVTLGLDGLSGWFLLILGLLAAATCAWALPDGRGAAPSQRVPLPLFLGGAVLCLAGADGLTLLLGLQGAALAAWAMLAPDGEATRPGDAAPARPALLAALLGGACLLAALALLGAGPPGAASMRFAALRAAPPEGWRAAAVLGLVLLGAGAPAGLLRARRGAAGTAPGHVAALLAGGTAALGAYVVARLLLDLAGPAQPAWWGLCLSVLGAAVALLGAQRAQAAVELDGLVAGTAAVQAGLVVLGFGLAAVFRAADLGPLAALAAGAALLHALHAALFLALLFLCTAEVAAAAGSRALDRLGGLVAGMPAVAACTAAGAAAACFLPPSAGFASGWLLLQATLAAWRAGDVALQLVVAGVLAAVALAASLTAVAMLRLLGLAFLGRPRHPRTAGAADAAGPARPVLAGLAALSLGLGLLPGPLLLLAGPALGRLTGTAAAEVAGPLLVQAGGEGGRLLPLAVPLLLAAATGALVWVTRARGGAPPAARGPAWEGGFMAPPPHLPFGDPATQPGAAGLTLDWPPQRARPAAAVAAAEAHGRPERAVPAPDTLREPARALLLALGGRWRGGLGEGSARRGLALLLGMLLAALVLATWLGPRP